MCLQYGQCIAGPPLGHDEIDPLLGLFLLWITTAPAVDFHHRPVSQPVDELHRCNTRCSGDLTPPPLGVQAVAGNGSDKCCLGHVCAGQRVNSRVGYGVSAAGRGLTTVSEGVQMVHQGDSTGSISSLTFHQASGPTDSSASSTPLLSPEATMIKPRRTRLLLAAVPAVLLATSLVGCGLAEDAVKNKAEDAAKSEGVDLDLDDLEDGNIDIDTTDGGASTGKLAEGLPDRRGAGRRRRDPRRQLHQEPRLLDRHHQGRPAGGDKNAAYDAADEVLLGADLESATPRRPTTAPGSSGSTLSASYVVDLVSPTRTASSSTTSSLRSRLTTPIRQTSAGAALRCGDTEQAPVGWRVLTDRAW